MTTQHVVKIDGGAIAQAMERLAAIGAPGGAPVKSAGGAGGKVEAAGPTEKTQGEMALAAEKQVKATEGMKGFMGRLGKTLGIQVGLSSILKQSQIFTGTIGSIFQIFGALVDVILAPFLPIIVPAIRMLASFIPMIYSVTSKVGAWIQENLTVDKINEKFNAGIEKFFAFLESFLPEWMTKPFKDTLLGVNWGQVIKGMALGAIVLLVLRRFGFFKLLAPIGRMLMRIPFLGALFKTLWTKLAGLGGVLAKALIPGFGKIMGKNVTATGKEVAKKGTKLKTAAEIRADKAGKGGGMFGGLKNFAKNLKPSNMVKAAAKAGPMGLLKGVGKRIVPGLSSAFLMYQGVKGAMDVYKSNRAAGTSFWKSVGKASAVGGTAVAASALSLVPGGGLLAPIAGGIAIDQMTKAMAITVNVDGKEVMQHEYDRMKNEEARTSGEGYAVQTDSQVSG